MLVVLIYAITLMLAVLLSELASRSVLSTAVLFLAVGFAGGMLGWLKFGPRHPVVSQLAELALTTMTFAGGWTRWPNVCGVWARGARRMELARKLDCAKLSGIRRAPDRSGRGRTSRCVGVWSGCVKGSTLV